MHFSTDCFSSLKWFTNVWIQSHRQIILSPNFNFFPLGLGHWVRLFPGCSFQGSIIYLSWHLSHSLILPTLLPQINWPPNNTNLHACFALHSVFSMSLVVSLGLLLWILNWLGERPSFPSDNLNLKSGPVVYPLSILLLSQEIWLHWNCLPVGQTCLFNNHLAPPKPHVPLGGRSLVPLQTELLGPEAQGLWSSRAGALFSSICSETK